MKKYLILLQGLCLITIMSSCTVPKTIIAEDMKLGMSYPAVVQNEMKIQREDKLSITIHSANPELTIPFNMNGNSLQTNTEGEIVGASASTGQHEGYTVDLEGNIDFPVLGKMHVEGLTRQELSADIKKKLITGNFVNDPIVAIELLNLRIPVLGEVQQVGVLTAPEGRMTIVEAITRAGGLTSNALPEKISVIRTDNNVRKILTVNFRSKEMFDSPAYYLQQNDIVFVHPRSAKSTEREERSWRNYSTFVGLLSLGITVLWYLKN